VCLLRGTDWIFQLCTHRFPRLIFLITARAVQQYSSTAIQQYSSTAIQQYSNTAVQQYSSTAVAFKHLLSYSSPYTAEFLRRQIRNLNVKTSETQKLWGMCCMLRSRRMFCLYQRTPNTDVAPSYAAAAMFVVISVSERTLKTGLNQCEELHRLS
jgi:hypothetical protein